MLLELLGSKPESYSLKETRLGHPSLISQMKK